MKGKQQKPLQRMRFGTDLKGEVMVMVMVFIYRIFYMYIFKCGFHPTHES